MKVVLDTNVLIASLISHGTCFELLEHCVKYHTVYTSRYIMDEFSEKLVSKFKYPRTTAEQAAALIASRFITVETLADVSVSFSDKDDIPVLLTALAAECDCLITGDKELQALQEYRGIKIISPSQFWEID